MDILKDFLRPEVIWTLIGIILLISEFVVPGLVIFFFGMGALLVAALSAFTDISLNAQLLTFIIASVVFLVTLRRWLKGIFKGYSVTRKNMRQDMEESIGQKAIAVERIEPGRTGKVEFRGTNWSAQADDVIEKGAAVEIIDRDSLTFKVKSMS